MKKIILCVLFLVCISFVSGATLQGTIYDIGLNKIKDVLVTIDSTPKQSMVSTDSLYYFELNPGTYTLTAQQLSGNITIASTAEQIKIDQQGNFRVDLILFPELETAPEDIDVSNLRSTNNNSSYYIIAGICIIIIILLVLLKRRKKNKVNIEDDEASVVLNFIKKNNGRTTQKDIRKSLAMSEAKISLIITELEHKGLIAKIKKGRGNIIILKK